MIADNVAVVTASLAGRDVTLVAVVKYASTPDIQAVVDAGVRDLGFNYVQHAEEVLSQVKGDIISHVIGPLQRNKVRRVLAFADLIHSVDSRKLLDKIERVAAELDRDVNVLLQVNTDPDKRHGIPESEIQSFLQELPVYERVFIRGLMTIGPAVDSAEAARPVFQRMRELLSALALIDNPCISPHHLSMGMSGDYRVAVQEGATLVRVGSALFA